MQLDEYIKILDQKYIICPRQQEWHELFVLIERYCETEGIQTLFDSRSSYLMPLLMLAWQETSDYQKNERFKYQLKFADENGFFYREGINGIHGYLRFLNFVGNIGKYTRMNAAVFFCGF